MYANKTYYEYKHTDTLGMIETANHGGKVFYYDDYYISPVLNRAAIWNQGKRMIIDYLPSHTSNITSMAILKPYIALGHADGTLIVYKQEKKVKALTKLHSKELEEKGGEWTEILNYKSHKSAVSTIYFSNNYLISGSADTTITIWDVVGAEALYRLQGHKGSITCLTVLEEGKLLISGGKDMLVKIWEIETQHCVQTMIDFKNEIWSVAKSPDEKRIFVGSADPEIQVFDTSAILEAEKKHMAPLRHMGALFRERETKLRTIEVNNDHMLAVLDDSNIVEFFIRESNEVIAKNIEKAEKKYKKKVKNQQNKMKDDEKLVDESDSEEEDTLVPLDDMTKEQRIQEFETAKNEYRKLSNLSIAVPIRSLQYNPSKQEVLMGTSKNTIELYGIGEILKRKKPETLHAKSLMKIANVGHQSPIRSLEMNKEGTLMCSSSEGQCKIWNIRDHRLVRNIDKTGSVTATAFLPGNNYLAIGTKSGSLSVFDLNTSLPVYTIDDAHKGPIYSLLLTADGKSLLTGSEDRTIAYWDIQVKRESNRMTIVLEHMHSMKMTDTVMNVQMSKTGKYIAIALFDNTVKMFYADTLKFFLSFYGHALPVNYLDMSDDEELMVTAANDKTIKIWGLKFGDCHRSIRAHSNAITCVKFVQNTHHFFSISKDGSIKRYDADTGDCFQVLRPATSQSPLQSLIVSPDAQSVAVAGHDRAIYIYEQTNNLLFLDEELEKDLVKDYEEHLPNSQQFKDISHGQQESSVAVTRTLDTIKTGEVLIEGIETAMEEDQRWATYYSSLEAGLKDVTKPGKNPLLIRKTVPEYIMWHLRRIKRTHLETVLSILSYDHAVYILKHISKHMSSLTSIDPLTEFLGRVVITLVRIYNHTLYKDIELYPMLHDINTHLKKQLSDVRYAVGYNTSALSMVKRRLALEKSMQQSNLIDHATRDALSRRQEKKLGRYLERKRARGDDVEDDDDHVGVQADWVRKKRERAQADGQARAKKLLKIIDE